MGNPHPNMSGLRPPWKKGVSAHPEGRPKKKPITLAHERQTDMPLPDDIRKKLMARGFKGRTYAHAEAFGSAIQAIKGDTAALREITDRVEGKVEQPVAVTQTGAPEDAELPALLLELVQLYLGHKRG